MSLLQSLRGTGVAVVTPFKKDESVDFVALEKLINFLVEGGVNYIVALGTTGETPTLEKQEKIDIIHCVAQTLANRIPMVVGIGGNSTKAVAQDVATYPLDNAVAVLSASPYYNKPSQEGLIAHYTAVAEASPKPIIMYNVPGRTGKNMEAATTLALANNVKNIKGIKEAAGNITQCLAIVNNRPADFLVVSGDDELAFPELAAGIDGVISVAANCFPKQFSSMVQNALDGNFKHAKSINAALVDCYHLLFAENNPAGVKAFLTELKLIENVMRLPVTPLSSHLHQSVKQYLSKVNF